MARIHHMEPMDGHDISPPSARSTGLVLAAAAALAAWAARHGLWLWPLAGASALLAVLAWLKPAVLEPLNRAWFRLSLLLSKVMTPIVMGLLFYGLITPFGLLMRLAGSDPLRLKRTGKESTWWRKRKADDEASGGMDKQF